MHDLGAETAGSEISHGLAMARVEVGATAQEDHGPVPEVLREDSETLPSIAEDDRTTRAVVDVAQRSDVDVPLAEVALKGTLTEAGLAALWGEPKVEHQRAAFFGNEPYLFSGPSRVAEAVERVHTISVGQARGARSGRLVSGIS